MTDPTQSGDPVEDILRQTQTSDRVRAAAWDAVYQAKDDSDREQRIRVLPLPEDVKAKLWDVSAQQQAAPFGRPTEEPSQVWEGAKAFGRTINPITALNALGDMVIPEAVGEAMGRKNTGPVNAVYGMAQAHNEARARADRQWNKGDYIGGGMHRLYAALPLVGPSLSNAANAIEEGRVGEGIGETFGIGAMTFGPQALNNARLPVPPVARNSNQAEAAAIQFGQQRGVPIDAATATGSKQLRNVQEVSANSLGGHAIAERFKTSQADALQRVGGELADRANPTRLGRAGAPSDAVSAGEAVTGRLEGRINAQARMADSAYGELRSLEQQAQQRINQSGGVQAPPNAGAPFTNVPLAVDVASSKRALRPLYESLKRERELIGTLQGGKARTLVALDNLMNGPDLAPLSVVDGALGDLKAMARTGDLPALRTQGQATAAEAVKALEAQVTASARAAGPDVFSALQRGRQATVGKYKTAEVREMLNVDEPVQVFRQLTQAKDIGLERLRAVSSETPREVPKVARAYLEGLLDTAMAEGRFAHTDKLWSEWQKLGPESKAILFQDRGLIKDLDNFFLLAKKIGENPNPSGTAKMLTATNVIASVPLNVVARLMYSRAGVRLLTNGARIPLNNRGAVSVWRAELGNLLGQETRGLNLAPAAEDQETTEPATERRR